MFDFRASAPRRPLSLTPLIDVVFILLLFFMLASNFDQWHAVGVSSSTVATVPSDKPASVIQLQDNGTATLDGALLSDSKIASALRGRVATDTAHRVRLIPAKATTVQQLMGQVDLIRGTGVEHLGIE